jgi:DNA-binding LytR/AlgR family response regulator
MKCLIVEDEPLAAKVIIKYLDNLDDFELVKVCTNAADAFNILNKERIDLMFLDIKMPQLSGLEFLKTLRKPPRVILTTAYREYALESYELDVVDYLLKPFSFERFLKAINKVLDRNVVEQTGISESKSEESNSYIFVKSDKKNVKILYSDVLYIEGLKDYVKIKTKNENIISYLTLSKLDKTLPSNSFLRIHRSYIVSLENVKAFTASAIEVPGKTLPIGRYYKDRVMKKLGEQRN